jgi:ATP-dependent DNA helicase PIF1
MKITTEDPNQPPPVPVPEGDPAKDFQEAAMDGKNIHLSGMAGTGKTTLIRNFIKDHEDVVDIVAPTGIAALNIGGMTIHRWTGMLLGPGSDQRDPNETNETYFRWLCDQPYRSIRRGFERIVRCKVLVIDEISMLSGRQLNFIEWMFRKLRDDDRPWGGCQVITVGDFLQLAPVRKGEAKPYDWAFADPVWEQSGFTNILLEKIHRQTQLDFISALCAVRVAKVSGRAAQTLHNRIVMFPDANIPRLFTHNSMVDKWNTAMLEDVPGEATEFVGEIFGDQKAGEFIADNLLTPRNLFLKVGCQVMMTVNDPDGMYVNGTAGKVTQISRDFIYVETERMGEVMVSKRVWKNGKPGQEAFAEYVQFP